MYTYITESLCCTAETKTLSINYTSIKKKESVHFHRLYSQQILQRNKSNVIEEEK